MNDYKDNILYSEMIIKITYYIVILWIAYRFNRDLHRNNFPKENNHHDDRDSVYVRSEFTDFEGWVKIDKH